MPLGSPGGVRRMWCAVHCAEVVSILRLCCATCDRLPGMRLLRLLVVSSVAIGLVGGADGRVFLPEGSAPVVRQVKALLHSKWPQAAWTTVQISKSFAAAPHIVSLNSGPSYACALGNFTGGGLLLEDPLGSSSLTMPDLPAAVSHLSGARLRGRVVDIRYDWATISEQQVHAVMPFDGAESECGYVLSRRCTFSCEGCPCAA